MNEKTLTPEPQAVAGPSGEANKRRRSSSSNSSNSSSTSSSSSDNKRRWSCRHKHKKSKRGKHSKQLMDKLFKEMGELRKIVTFNNFNTACNDNVSIHTGSEELYQQLDQDYNEINSDHEDSNPNLVFDIETKLKEPSIPKTSEGFLKKLLKVQRLGSASWSDVRYAETQKLYNHTPGFTDLEIERLQQRISF